MPNLRALFLASALTCTAVGCDGGMSSGDAGSRPDGAVRDAGASLDAGEGDAGRALDGGAPVVPDAGGPDAASPDAGSADAARSTEGMVCVFHTQCDPDQYCASEGFGAPRRCRVGDERGELGFEEPCTSSSDCASGFCWSWTEQLCSKQCEDDSDCGETWDTCRTYRDGPEKFCAAS